MMKRIALFFIAAILGLTCASPLAAKALSEAQQNLFNQNINYFDIDECATAGSQNATKSNNKLYVIGDSITVGMKDLGNLHAKLSNAGWDVTDIEATGSITIDASIPKVQADNNNAVSSAGNVLVGLGTNRTANPSKSIDNMIDAIHQKNPDAQIYWINAYSTRNDYSSFNNILKNKLGDGKITKILDWAKEASNHPAKYDFDPAQGVHLDPQGYIYRSVWVANELGKPEGGQSGTGKANGGTFPALDESKMAKAIDDWVEKQNSNSKLKGLGSTIVASAKQANINPFLIVAIAREESGMADPDDWNVSHANNSFGRTATSSQPHVDGAKKWYKWSSVKASVDSSANENKNASGGGDIAKYLRNQYASILDKSDLTTLFLKYAPPGDNNDTQQYTANVKSWINNLVKSSGGPVAQDSSTLGDVCCDMASQLSGNNNAEKIWNYFIDKGFNNTQVAAILGNLQQESGFSPTIVNGDSGAYGIGQWLGGRLVNLKNKPNSDTLSVQLDFMWDELKGDYSAAVLEPLKNADDLENAVDIWLEHYEIPCSPGNCGGELKIRTDFARAWLNKSKGGAGADTSATSDTPAATDSCGSAGSSGYKNPFHDEANVGRSRVDEGVDYYATSGSVPVYAIGNAEIKFATDKSTFYTTSHGHADWITYQLTDGPAKGKYIYVSEACTITPDILSGKTTRVTSETKLCDMLPDSIEMGWSMSPPTQAAAAYGVYTQGHATAYGQNFEELMNSLGVKAKACYGFPGEKLQGSLPDGWPTWGPNPSNKAGGTHC